MSIQRLVEALRRIALFHDLRPDQISQIARRAERVRFKPDDAIIRAGQLGDAAYLIISGTAERTSGPGRCGSEKLEPGTLIGEMAMFVETEFSSTVVCREPVKALKITRSGLLDLMVSDLTLADHILDKLAGRLRQLAGELRRIDAMLSPAVDSAQPPQPSESLRLLPPLVQSRH